MFDSFKKFAMITGSAAMLSTGALAAVPKAASADTTSTLLTAAGIVGALVLYNNYQHKRQAANQVVGYTANGGTIFGDGRIQLANGQTVYPNSNGQYPGGQYAYYNARSNNVRYDYNRTGQFDTTGRHRNNGNGFNGTGNNNASWHRNTTANNHMRDQDDRGRKHDKDKDKDKDKDHH